MEDNVVLFTGNIKQCDFSYYELIEEVQDLISLFQDPGLPPKAREETYNRIIQLTGRL
ncbi:hypothetical protein [Lentibacillus juripiscarius]|uniref:Uncharacterized protein n=1 Tax=Lentibacillus juripiscarius TaxID=257446 RepID=A0ABW5V3C6_9BACI